MRLRPKIFSPLLRSFAAVTLVAWIGAQTLCQAHCLSGACHDDSDDSSCPATADAKSHHGDDDHGSLPCGHDHGAEASCLTLKTALTANGMSLQVTPQFSLLHTITPSTVSIDAMATELAASFSRQARPREWVFTPVVCLGPAFRSHAPPVLL